MSASHGIPHPSPEKAADGAPTPISTSFGAQEIGWQALGPAIACTILATTVVTLRWYTRCRLARCLGVDDVVILFSIVGSYCKTTAMLHETNNRHRFLPGACAPSSAQN
jgi:hypothetical protein